MSGESFTEHPVEWVEDHAGSGITIAATAALLYATMRAPGGRAAVEGVRAALATGREALGARELFGYTLAGAESEARTFGASSKYQLINFGHGLRFTEANGSTLEARRGFFGDWQVRLRTPLTTGSLQLGHVRLVLDEPSHTGLMGDRVASLAESKFQVARGRINTLSGPDRGRISSGDDEMSIAGPGYSFTVGFHMKPEGLPEPLAAPSEFDKVGGYWHGIYGRHRVQSTALNSVVEMDGRLFTPEGFYSGNHLTRFDALIAQLKLPKTPG